MNRLGKYTFIISIVALLFSSCSNKPNEIIDPETCTHENVVFDEEIEPTIESDGHTSGHHCMRCNKILDGHDVLKYGHMLINDETNIKVTNRVSSFKVNDVSFQAGYVTKTADFLILNNRGVFTNTSPVYKIKSISFNISSSSRDIYLTMGYDALPFLDEELINKTHYEKTFDEHNRFFLISNHDINSVVLADFELTYFYLEKGEEENKLPNIDIKTKDGKDITSREYYSESTVTIADPNNDTYNLINLSAGIRVRGNSTSGEDKKPYRIKFDKKQSIFGLTKAKNWVLLAEYYDPTIMHNYVAQSIVGMLNEPKVVLHPHHVTVTLNGKYQGVYTFIEQPDEKEGRVNIEQELTTDTDIKDINFLIELDGRAMESGQEDINYVKVYGSYYEIKYPEIDEFPDYDEGSNTSNMFNQFVTYLKEYLKQAWNAMNDRSLAKIMNIFDINSIYNQAALDIYTDERDHSWLSVKMFKDSSGRLNFGPCWDYDIVAWGTIWSGSYYTNPFKDSVESTYRPSNEWLYVLTDLIEASKEEFKNYFHNFLINKQNDILKCFCDEFGLISQEVIKNTSLWYSNNIGITYENVRFFNYYLNNRCAELLNRF